MEWKTIDSAPKDGSGFVGTDGKLAFTTRWCAYYKKWPHEEGGPEYNYRWTGESNCSTSPWSPTHWMPLPAPPSSD